MTRALSYKIAHRRGWRLNRGSAIANLPPTIANHRSENVNQTPAIVNQRGLINDRRGLIAHPALR